MDLGCMIEKARELDEVAFSRLTVEFYPKIYKFFYYRVRSKEDAEDLSSDVFVKVVKAIKHQNGNFEAWLFKIARNLLIDYYRRKGRRRETSLEVLNGDDISFSMKNDKALFPEDIKRMLSLLTPEQGEVVFLKFVERHTNKEIANIMSKSIGAVKLLQFRGIATLKDIMKKELAEK